MNNVLYFASDYQEGCHPDILKRLSETNMLSTSGYGTDEFTENAVKLIRKACKAPKADVKFLVGGTQTNATVIDALLQSYEGVIAADSGHVAVHEAGAIEFGGHKVLPLKSELGKINGDQIEAYLKDFYNDGNCDHMVQPGMVYISQPTEFGTLYSKAELESISKVCRKNKIPLYVDGARLAYAFGSSSNDVTLPDLAKLCDAFYIGGTKCGTLFGEAVVIPDPELIPHFFTIIKQHGALFAKGRLLGLQFEEMFKNDLYFEVGKTAVSYAEDIKIALVAKKIKLYFNSPTNQVFFIMENDKLPVLGKKVVYSFWEKYDETHTVIRLATSWATSKENLDSLIKIIEEL